MKNDYSGKRVTVMGLGRFGGGVAAARWLARQGAIVTVTDSAEASTLADSLAALKDVPVAAINLGGHREEDFKCADLVVVNPAVRPDSPWLDVARRMTARLCTEIELFMENCQGIIIGVTGSNGKSTTAAMIASILTTDGRHTFLGGNIGTSLLDQLPMITEQSYVVLEISSFQLWHLSRKVKMPHLAVVTGCTPNHLDWHGDFPSYVAAKQRILVEQTSDDYAVLNPFDRESARWEQFVRGKLVDLPSMNELPELSVPGEHNRLNAALATAAGYALGCQKESIQTGLINFRPLGQRLEWVATVAGRHFYNDSSATTPESTIAAMQSFDAPIWLLAGGKNKGFNFRPLVETIARKACGAAFFGSAKEELLAQVQRIAPKFNVTTTVTMEEAFDWCWQCSRPGDIILLSPACAATDQFLNFRKRGERFVELINALYNA